MANKKLTVVQKYEAIEKMLNGEAVENFSIEDALAFIGERKAQTIRKNTPNPDRKPTPKELEKQTEREGIYTEIGFVLTSAEKMTIGEMQKSSATLGVLSNQKISAMLADMIEVGNVVRIKEKGKTYFALAPIGE